ncbi:hypothetical protein [Sphingomonas sp.]|uniref:hypothetical protein n=1 Tax=Sphingomonas sp. TaxID=28214 RepID=UPI0025F44FA1|nr:hypothetical protein [Sphingomonas sp.]
MDNLMLYFGMALTALAGLAILSLVGLRAFAGWLDYKRAELAIGQDRGAGGATASTFARIDIADMKERLRKLEAIAAGVDI